MKAEGKKHLPLWFPFVVGCLVADSAVGQKPSSYEYGIFQLRQHIQTSPFNFSMKGLGNRILLMYIKDKIFSVSDRENFIFNIHEEYGLENIQTDSDRLRDFF